MEKWKRGVGRIVLTPEELSNLIRVAYREVIDKIPDRLEYYREIATTNKLKNDWDMTQLKDQLKAKFL